MYIGIYIAEEQARTTGHLCLYSMEQETLNREMSVSKIENSHFVLGYIFYRFNLLNTFPLSTWIMFS